ncbi:MAG: transcriptional regulator [Parcubacteria group bacterium GW2011_GWA1_47_10]|nr:MAG: transcriptional regulator [Parcubacteria group bacterium GW2011_GWA1_47_10]
MAVKLGGGVTDPGGNFHLRLAIENAKSVNMPKDTIQRAIERAATSKEHMETVVYEGYGPGGIAVIAEGVTDNKQRTSANVKHLFDRSGGSLASPGAVNYLFERVMLGERKIIFRPLFRLDVTPEVAGEVANLLNALLDLEDIAEVYTNL